MADEKTRDASLQSNTPQTKSLDTEDRTDGLRRPAELKIGQLVSERYTIKASLGRGGIGSVYRVHQILLDKEFALKTLNPVTASSATMRRFHLEAQSAGKLNHPNIVKAFDFGLIDGVQPFLVMDVIEGKTLSRILKQGKLPLNIFLEIFIPLTQAIAYAHSEGVVHRDLKPSNIVLEPDKENAGKYIPKLIDFGLAKLTDSDSLSQHQTLTKAGDVIGTPLYMSPEQCSGTSVDHRSDIYSLGCVMFEALTGKPPFRADTAIETLMQHGTKRPPLLNETCEGIEFPPELEELIDTLLAKDPAERFESCTLVADQLIAIKSSTNDETNEEEIAIAIARLADEPSTNPASLRQISILLFLGAVLALAAAIFVVNSSRTTPDTAQGAAVQHAMLPTEQAGPLSADRLTAPPDDGKAIVPWAKLEGANRVFHFPKNRRLGKLGWKVGTGYELALATGLVRLPQDTKIIFMCSEMMLRSPTDVGGFGTDDFRGVNVKLGEILTGEEVVEKSMSSLLASKNLTLVTITDGSLSADNLSKLGSLPKLTWLTLIGNEAKLEELAALKNRVFARCCVLSN
ncbi:MAG: serine/threonine-protein kinase [Candidatus Melainabacteria bacterium]|nr:serine/threonine-protein kinase [Candidatus Melainabacteria bacterium]